MQLDYVDVLHYDNGTYQMEEDDKQYRGWAFQIANAWNIPEKQATGNVMVEVEVNMSDVVPLVYKGMHGQFALKKGTKIHANHIIKCHYAADVTSLEHDLREMLPTFLRKQPSSPAALLPPESQSFLALNAPKPALGLEHKEDVHTEMTAKSTSDIYKKFHEKLSRTLQNYLDHLNAAKIGEKSAAQTLLAEKISFVNDELKKCLDDSKDKSDTVQLAAIKAFKQKVSSDEIMNKYRDDHKWSSCIRTLDIIASAFLFPIGLTRMVVNYGQYRTVRFWQSTGFKVKTRLLFDIQNGENEARFKQTHRR